jgi:hypothetical protein
MKKYIKLKDYFTHILQEVIKADTDFKFKNKNEFNGPVAKTEFEQLERKYMKDLAPQSLNINNIEITLYLKKYFPSALQRLWLWVTRKKTEDLFCIGTAKDYEVPVKLSITRTDAFSPLKAQTDPKEYEDKMVAL